MKNEKSHNGQKAEMPRVGGSVNKSELSEMFKAETDLRSLANEYEHLLDQKFNLLEELELASTSEHRSVISSRLKSCNERLVELDTMRNHLAGFTLLDVLSPFVVGLVLSKEDEVNGLSIKLHLSFGKASTSKEATINAIENFEKSIEAKNGYGVALPLALPISEEFLSDTYWSTAGGSLIQEIEGMVKSLEGSDTPVDSHTRRAYESILAMINARSLLATHATGK